VNLVVLRFMGLAVLVVVAQVVITMGHSVLRLVKMERLIKVAELVADHGLVVAMSMVVQAVQV
jgi:hypothetical protein